MAVNRCRAMPDTAPDLFIPAPPNIVAIDGGKSSLEMVNINGEQPCTPVSPADLDFLRQDPFCRAVERNIDIIGDASTHSIRSTKYYCLLFKIDSFPLFAVNCSIEICQTRGPSPDAIQLDKVLELLNLCMYVHNTHLSIHIVLFDRKKIKKSKESQRTVVYPCIPQ